MVDTGSGGFCRLSVAVLEVDGADHSEFRVPSSAVVDPFVRMPQRSCEISLAQEPFAVLSSCHEAPRSAKACSISGTVLCAAISAVRSTRACAARKV